jgi:LacI family transcriptional regulator/LacI family repressor for deo operon, udp, cdd, tsx, nupC, and nupG
VAATDTERGQSTLDLLVAAQATAVFCYNDLIAIGVLTACRQRGLAVPAQFSIVGFDDIELSSFINPSLTTVHQPRSKLGQLAITMVLELLNGETVQDQVLPCHLEVRESTTISPDLL